MLRHLLIVDPQIDFCDIPEKMGALAVPGAHADMLRLSYFLGQFGHYFDGIYVTLDTHSLLHIAHSIWWKNKRGENPDCFITITLKDVLEEKWQTSFDKHQQRSVNYIDALEASGRYTLTIWPDHCIVGSRGHSVHPLLLEALHAWEYEKGVPVCFVPKGTNCLTEHYSAIRAEIPDPEDAATQPNFALLKKLAGADEIYIAGEALSHCVANTVRDILKYSSKEIANKIILIADCSSTVPGFEAVSKAFLQEISAAGIRVKFLEGITSQWKPSHC